jgi:hypothetical protein
VDRVSRRESLRRLTAHFAGLLFVALASDRGALAQTRVIIISVDGLRPDAITAEHAPRMLALRQAGAVAETAINDLPSATLPNHATMLTGLLGDVHRLVVDFEIPGRIRKATVFDFAHDAGLGCAFFASKTKLRFLAHDAALEIIDIDEPDAIVGRLAASLTAEGPALFFLHLREPDSTGHAEGWMSDAYLSAVSRMDALVGSVVAAAAGDESHDTYILLTSDHGGEARNHFMNIRENREIPWSVTGPGIQSGRVLRGSISTADTTPTVLWLLGLNPPDGLSGVARTDLFDDADPPVTDAAPIPIVGIPCFILVIPAVFFLAAAVRRPA